MTNYSSFERLKMLEFHLVLNNPLNRKHSKISFSKERTKFKMTAEPPPRPDSYDLPEQVFKGSTGFGLVPILLIALLVTLVLLYIVIKFKCRQRSCNHSCEDV
jgi:hypothetical protein